MGVVLMARRVSSTDGATPEEGWFLTSSEMRKFGTLVGVVGVLLSAGIAIATAQTQVANKADRAAVDSIGRVATVVATRLDRLEAQRDDIANLRNDLNSVLRLACAKATLAEQHLTGVRCP